jgi:hypothetical protein
MWPKLLMQLIDMLPRLAKLLPSLERLMIGGGAAAVAVEGVSELREELGRNSNAHAGLVRQLQDQTIQLAAVEEEVRRLRMNIEHQERRMEGLEGGLAQISLWVRVFGVTTVLLLLILAGIVLYLHAH